MFDKLKAFFNKSNSSLCSICGSEHGLWPSIAYDSPFHYSVLTDEDRVLLAELSADFCIIKHPEGIDRFIRCTLNIKVVDGCEDIEYGLWVSLSEKSFNDYKDNYAKTTNAVYFGWICNNLEGYNESINIPADIVTRGADERPEVVPHQDFDHPLVHDYYNGITIEEAKRRVDNVING